MASHKPEKSLYLSTSGNAVLFTKTGLPSPLDLSSDDNSLGTPIHIAKPRGSPPAEENGVPDIPAEGPGPCNGDKHGLSKKRSHACLERIKQDWNRALKVLEQDDITAKLKELALDMQLDSYPLRSISWRLFLGVLPPSPSEWVETVDRQRENYHSHERIANIDPHKKSETSSHPLSNESSSAWNQYFQDQDLWQIVDQDVSRTWPEEEIFSNISIRDMMGKILFTHAKAQSKFEYRQGMHELLANIIYMMCVESERCPVSSDLPEYLRHVLDPKYLEEDAYTLFSELMEYCDVWYDGGAEDAMFKARTNIRIETPFEKEGIVLGYTALSKKLNKIQGTLLKKYDSVLTEYLDSLGISPQVYGIRWVRLLFGREFVLKDILLLWDVLFAHGTSLDLIDYIAIAILVAMRDSLLNQDQGDCLLRLMKYPQDMPVRDVINHALHLKNPSWTYTPPILSPPILVERPVMAPPPRENAVADLNSAPSDDPSLWSEMEVGRPNTGAKVPRAKSNTLTSTAHHNTFLNKHKTLPGRIRIGKTASLGVSLPSPTKNQSEPGITSPLSAPPKSSENQASSLQKDIELLHVRSDYCVGKLTAYVDHLQDILYECKFPTKEKEDFAFLAVAGIKQVRDVLKGQLELGESSFGLDSTMYMYLRERSLAAGQPPPAPLTPPGDKERTKGLLKDVELDDSLDLFTNTSQPINSGAEMVEMHSPDPTTELPDQSPSHPLESDD